MACERRPCVGAHMMKRCDESVGEVGQFSGRSDVIRSAERSLFLGLIRDSDSEFQKNEISQFDR